MEAIVYHYPPDLLSLLVDTIPLLSKSKRDTLLFFRGAGVPPESFADLESRLRQDPSSINKYQIARTVLVRLNQRGERALRERREVLRRVCEFEDFGACWPEDQIKARGLVAEVRGVVNVKDSFTRMREERERERAERVAGERNRRQQAARRTERLDAARRRLASVVSESDPHKRGKALEVALGDVFTASDLRLREPFVVVDLLGDVIEQVDGAIEIDAEVYLVEAKWLNRRVDPTDVSRHVSRLLARANARGIVISASGFTPAAVSTARDALNATTIILCELSEIVRALELRRPLGDVLREKVRAALLDRNPYLEAAD